MPNLDLPILVVDDAKFSSMVVGRTLRNAPDIATYAS
jgi:hypothetical protein